MTREETPNSLSEVTQRFSKFLRENGYPEQVVWVEQTDLVWDQHQLCICVRERPTQIALDHAGKKYAAGIRNVLGVSLYAFSEVAGTAVAAVILPKDEDTAQRHLMPRGGLKLSAATQKLRARRITNSLTWLILSMRYKASSRLFWDQYLEYS